MWRSFWQSKFTLLIIICLGVVARFWALSQTPQYYDMGTFHAWGNYVWETGLYATYKNVWSDYLPLPMLAFGAIRGLTQLVPFSFPDLFRLFWMAIEAILIGLILINLKTKNYSLLAILWLFPPFLMNTGWWGQVDSIPALLTVLSLVLLNGSSKWGSAISYSLAVALKPIMLITGPVFFVLGWQKKALPQLLVTGILTLALTALPAVVPTFKDFSFLSPTQAFGFVVKQSAYQSSMYPGTTINGWNLWSIQGTFWQPDNVAVLGITPQQVGYLMFGFCLLFIVFQWYKSHFDPSLAPLVAGQLLLAFYTFTTRMHERHLMFALPFLLIAAKDLRTRLATYSLSLLYLGNLWGALYWVNNAQVWPFSQGILALCSWLVVLASLIVIFQPKFSLKKLSLEVLILLLALTLRLISLANPPSMIFDEVYHSFTAKELLHNNIAAWEWWTTPPAGFAYEWTHPPIAKYGMVVGMLLFGENSFGWRIGSAIMGTISIAGIYYLAKLLTKSREIALLAMFLLSIEGLHLVQSRVGMNDAYMFCFLVWSLVFALSRHWKRAGIFFGLALASKWSALYGIIPLAIIYLEQSISTIHDLRSTIKFVFAPIRLLAISIIIYLLSFVPFLQAGHTTEQLVELHRQMWYYHTHLVATHAYQSVPWQWLTVTRPVWYFVEYGEGVKSNIYAQGNPTLLWFGLFSFFFIFFLSITSFIKSKLSRLSPNPHNLFPNFLLLALAAIFTVPWFFSPRIMFFYHYLPTASFLTILSAMVLNKLPKAWQIIFMFIFALTFVVLSPVYYGFTTSNLYWDTLFAIFPSWK